MGVTLGKYEKSPPSPPLDAKKNTFSEVFHFKISFLHLISNELTGVYLVKAHKHSISSDTT